MAMLLTNPKIQPLAEERRRHQRVKVNLLGRYMLADGREFPCQVVNMSPGGIALIAPIIGNPGERVVAYIDHLGRLEGTIAREIENGFAMTIAATLRKRDELATQLTWLANRHLLNKAEDRRHNRFAPRNPQARLILADGNAVDCRVIDLSQSGAAIAIAARLRPAVGVVVTIGRTAGRVVRHIDEGFAVEFARLQRPDIVEQNVTAN